MPSERRPPSETRTSGTRKSGASSTSTSIPGYDDAFRRAERLEREALAAGEECRDPSTEVFHLTDDSIDDDGRRRRAPAFVADPGRAKAEAAAEAALAQAQREAAEMEPED